MNIEGLKKKLKEDLRLLEGKQGELRRQGVSEFSIDFREINSQIEEIKKKIRSLEDPEVESEKLSIKKRKKEKDRGMEM